MAEDRLLTGTCALCGEQVQGKKFDHRELYSDEALLTKPEADKWLTVANPLLLGIQCPQCGSLYCHPAHKRQLGFKLFRGYSKGQCLQCDASLEEYIRIFHLNVDTPPELSLEGEKTVAKAEGSKSKRDLAAIREQLKGHAWRDQPQQAQQLLAEIEANRDVLIQELVKGARYVDSKAWDNRQLQTEAFIQLGALGELGADWAFGAAYFGEIEVAEIIEAATLEKAPLQDFSRYLSLRMSTAIVLAELIRYRKEESLTAPIAAVCQDLSASDKTIAPGLLTELVHHLRGLYHLAAVRNCLLEIAQGNLLIADPENDSIWLANFIPGPAWYAAQIVLSEGASEDVEALVSQFFTGLTEDDWDWAEADTHYLNALFNSLPAERVPIDAILEALGDSRPEVRAMAASLLADHKLERVRAALVALADDESKVVAQSAARALGRLGMAGVEEVLSQLVEHPERKVRAEAQKALDQI